MRTVGELVRDRVLEVGQFVDYHPDERECWVNSENTGGEDAQLIRTEKDLGGWYIRKILKNGDIMLAPMYAAMHDKIELRGAIGFIRGTTELHRICSTCYSNKALGAVARSYMIYDLNEDNNYTHNIYSRTMFAFYPKGADVKGDEIHNNKIYYKVACADYFQEPKFYAYDNGGIEKSDKNGLLYRTPTSDSPVYVTTSNYTYESKPYHGIYVLASTCIDSDSKFAIYNIFYVMPNNVRSFSLAYSNGWSNSYNFGIRPTVYINAETCIDDKSGDGSLLETAWKFI